MDADQAALATLVGDIDQFDLHHWGRRSLHRSTGASFDHLLSIERVEELLTTAARQPTFRLVHDGVTLPRDRSTRPMRLGGRQLEDVADVATIAAAMHDGATLVLQSLQRTVADIARYCRSLERATSHPVQANAYLTPRGAAGLSAHVDEHDVFVVQIAGHKDWTIEDLGEVRVSAGDVLYLPSGTRHSASAQDEVSLHLTIGVLSVTYASVVRRMLDRVDDDELRRPLPLGFGRPGSPGLAEQIEKMSARAAAGLLDADHEKVALNEAATSRRRRRPFAVGHLRDVLELDDLGLSECVRLRPDVDLTFTTGSSPDTVRVQLVDRRLTFPAAMAPALRRIAVGDDVAIGDLPGLSDRSRIVLARRLIREAVLATR